MPQNKHRDIFEALRRDILDEKYEAGRPLPSAHALMKKFGVVRATAVSRVCAGLANCAEKMGSDVGGGGNYALLSHPQPHYGIAKTPVVLIGVGAVAPRRRFKPRRPRRTCRRCRAAPHAPEPLLRPSVEVHVDLPEPNPVMKGMGK